MSSPRRRWGGTGRPQPPTCPRPQGHAVRPLTSQVRVNKVECREVVGRRQYPAAGKAPALEGTGAASTLALWPQERGGGEQETGMSGPHPTASSQGSSWWAGVRS